MILMLQYIVSEYGRLKLWISLVISIMRNMQVHDSDFYPITEMEFALLFCWNQISKTW